MCRKQMNMKKFFLLCFFRSRNYLESFKNKKENNAKVTLIT